jgi:hypothetical protein
MNKDGWWLIPTIVDVKCRLKINSATPQFAHFDARIEPSPEFHRGIRISCQWVDAADERWLSSVERGVQRFVALRSDAGRPVGQTTLVMSRIISHPIDTTEEVLAQNVLAQLSESFRSHEVFWERHSHGE